MLDSYKYLVRCATQQTLGILELDRQRGLTARNNGESVFPTLAPDDHNLNPYIMIKAPDVREAVAVYIMQRNATTFYTLPPMRVDALALNLSIEDRWIEVITGIPPKNKPVDNLCVSIWYFAGGLTTLVRSNYFLKKSSMFFDASNPEFPHLLTLVNRN